MNARRGTAVGIVLVVGIIVGLPAGYASYRNANLRNVRCVEPNVLYRSGQLSQIGLNRLIHDYGIRTVVSLRDSETADLAPPDVAEEKYCREMDIRYVRITPRSWWPDAEGRAPAEQGLESFLKVIEDPANHPVLLHCFAGVHRTGAMVAVYRMECEHWSNADALAELRANGYKNLDRELDVLTFLETYRPRR